MFPLICTLFKYFCCCCCFVFMSFWLIFGFPGYLDFGFCLIKLVFSSRILSASPGLLSVLGSLPFCHNCNSTPTNSLTFIVVQSKMCSDPCLSWLQGWHYSLVVEFHLNRFRIVVDNNHDTSFLSPSPFNLRHPFLILLFWWLCVCFQRRSFWAVVNGRRRRGILKARNISGRLKWLFSH